MTLRPPTSLARRGGALLALSVLAGTALVSTAGTASAATTSGCDTGQLPPVVLGDPGVQAHQAPAVYLFHTNGHYSLRVTHPGTSTMVVSGVITTSRALDGLHRVGLERRDTVRNGTDGRSVSFRLVNHGFVDGFNFTASCSRAVHVVLRIGSAAATPAQVHLGAGRTSPTSVPFTIERAHDRTPARVS